MPDETSVYAEEGTHAHTLAEVRLKQALGQRTRLPNGFRDSEHYSQSMEDYVEEYVSLVLERIATHQEHSGDDPVVDIERRLSMERWVPEQFGTGDVVIVSDMGIEVIDLKYGRGVRVEAEGNEQLRLYGLGAYDLYSPLYDIDRVYMTIVQPRLDSVSTDMLSVDELLTWAEDEVVPVAKLAYNGEGEFVAGEHCRFCAVRSTCRVRAEANLALAAEDFALNEPALLTVGEIGVILEQADELVRWASDVQKHALEQARDHGVTYPGWKLVEGRSRRVYADAEQAAQVIVNEGWPEDDVYKPPEPKGITDMTKLIGRQKFAELLEETGLVIKPTGRPVLVPESDKRPAISTIEQAQADFEEEIE